MRLLRTLFASVVLALLGSVALYAATDGFRAFTTETARRISVRERPADIPGVMLETQTGARVELTDLRGRWLLVDFIYTRCPTYCVALGSQFARLQDQLAGPLAQGKVQLVSISFDPVHDTPHELTSYLRRARSRGAGWFAGRPIDADGLHRLKRSFGLTVIPDGLGGYTHNAAIHVIDPQGRLVEIVDLNRSALAGRIILEKLGS
jgi:protein SCO1/2